MPECCSPPVADLLREERSINDELRLEVGVRAILGEETQIQGQVEVRQCLVQETSMASLITAHQQESVPWPYIAIHQFIVKSNII